VVLSVAACGRDAPVAEGAELDEQLAHCLAEAGHGDSLEDIYQRQADDPAFAEALEGCAAELGGIPLDPDALERAQEEHTSKVVGCMRDEGWDIQAPSDGESEALVLDRTRTDLPEHKQADFEDDLEGCGHVIVRS
jgi:hypothetical protein